jgi:hypothetical protein
VGADAGAGVAVPASLVGAGWMGAWVAGATAAGACGVIAGAEAGAVAGVGRSRCWSTGAIDAASLGGKAPNMDLGESRSVGALRRCGSPDIGRCGKRPSGACRGEP